MEVMVTMEPSVPVDTILVVTGVNDEEALEDGDSVVCVVRRTREPDMDVVMTNDETEGVGGCEDDLVVASSPPMPLVSRTLFMSISDNFQRQQV